MLLCIYYVLQHFTDWSNGGRREGRGRHKGWRPSTEIVDMNFSSWLRIAKHADESNVRNENDTAYYYFISNTPTTSGGKQRSFIIRDLPLFTTDQNNFFITNNEKNKGIIQCQFGMKSAITELYYDTKSNMLAVIKGAKRYILFPPGICRRMGIMNNPQHPFPRHSMVDFRNPRQAKSYGSDTIIAIDTIVRAGEMLYIPTNWSHYIVSLNYSIQCNTQSKMSINRKKRDGKSNVEDCLGDAVLRDRLR